MTLSGVHKRFGRRQVLSGLSLTVHRGEFVVILGPSGAGKSTLLRSITRLTEIDAGSVNTLGRSVQGLSNGELSTLRREVGFIFQSFNLVRRLSVIDNVLAGRVGQTPLWRVLLRRFARADRQIALAALDAVGLLPLAYGDVETLSGGQRQRVAIARALAQDPRLVLADEPIASLDPNTAASVLEILRDACKTRGIAVVCSLHQVELAYSVADHVLRVENGIAVADEYIGGIAPPEDPELSGTARTDTHRYGHGEERLPASRSG